MTEFTERQQAFIAHYLDCLNGAEAARRAGYAESGARQEAHRLLTHADIRAAIDAGLAERGMSRDEVLARITELARADIRELIEFDADGTMRGLRLRQDAPLHLIKKLTPTKYGTSIELHDAAAMLIKLGEHHGLFKKSDDILKYIDLSKLTDDQLDRLANGEDPLRVLIQQ